MFYVEHMSLVWSNEVNTMSRRVFIINQHVPRVTTLLDPNKDNQ